MRHRRGICRREPMEGAMKCSKQNLVPVLGVAILHGSSYNFTLGVVSKRQGDHSTQSDGVVILVVQNNLDHKHQSVGAKHGRYVAQVQFF